jgi:hypothetical protein
MRTELIFLLSWEMPVLASGQPAGHVAPAKDFSNIDHHIAAT